MSALEVNEACENMKMDQEFAKVCLLKNGFVFF